MTPERAIKTESHFTFLAETHENGFGGVISVFTRDTEVVVKLSNRNFLRFWVQW